MAQSPITVKPNAEVSGVPQSQLEDLAAALRVDLRDGDKLVFFGPTAPFDRSTPWQLVNASGRPEGGIRYYDTNQQEWIDVTGETGPIGPAGPQGDTGAAGPTGATGPAGLTGSAGADGLIGATGPIGPSGFTGANGAIGPAGPEGITGAAGPVGPIGPQGPPGVGAFLVPYDLGGGVVLVLESLAFDVFTADRVFNVLPTPSGIYGKLQLQVESAAAYNLDFHTNNVGTIFERNVAAPGGLNAITADIAVPSGFTVLNFEYINSRWMLNFV